MESLYVDLSSIVFSKSKRQLESSEVNVADEGRIEDLCVEF